MGAIFPIPVQWGAGRSELRTEFPNHPIVGLIHQLGMNNDRHWQMIHLTLLIEPIHLLMRLSQQRSRFSWRMVIRMARDFQVNGIAM